MADAANRSRGSGRRVRGAFAPKHDAGTATRHYRAFWQRRCRAAHRAAARRFGAQPTLCGGSWRGDPPERCLSRKAGIMRCCLIAIEHARNDKGLTREDLAERIRKSERYVVAIERGERPPSLKTRYQIVRCLGISADKLFYPEATLDENSATREITRMAATCTSKQLWFH